ncbi:MAG: diaminopimelate epimerase [Planctomycetota bacterium]
MIASHELLLVSAAGNRFAVADGFRGASPDEPAAAACALAGRVDGLLLLDRADAGAIRMTLYNADGGRAEACGNGLRCLAAIAVEEGYVPAGEVAVETDAGLRSVSTELRGGAATEATAAMGPIRLGRAFELEHDGRRLEVQPVDAGNPHAVVWLPAPDAVRLDRLGPAVAGCGRFPAGVNVEVAAPPTEGGPIAARVFERGVGETRSCGTGARATAQAAAERFGSPSPLPIAMPGGVLTILWSGWNDVYLRGPVQREGTIRL